jgi:predicted DCC family thiol-disulfide oxidoreductase YuxK
VPDRASSDIVLYDRDCGFCRWSLARLLDLDRRHRLRPVALQDPESDELLRGMSTDERYASAHLVTPDGRRYSGGEAVAPLLRLLPGGVPLSRVAERVPGALGLGYGWVARHRGWFGRRLSEGAKERATDRIDQRAAALGDG